MADEKNTPRPGDTLNPGGNPPDPAKLDPGAKHATEKAEQAALDRGGPLVPNVPGLGISESEPAGSTRPAGEARPSVEIPTYAPPEQAGPVQGVDVKDLPPQQGALQKRLLKAEQRIAWFLQHQPFVLPGGVTALNGMRARLHAARYQDNQDREGKALAEEAETLIGTLNLPDHEPDKN